MTLPHSESHRLILNCLSKKSIAFFSHLFGWLLSSRLVSLHQLRRHWVFFVFVFFWFVSFFVLFCFVFFFLQKEPVGRISY